MATPETLAAAGEFGYASKCIHTAWQEYLLEKVHLERLLLEETQLYEWAAECDDPVGTTGEAHAALASLNISSAEAARMRARNLRIDFNNKIRIAQNRFKYGVRDGYPGAVLVWRSYGRVDVVWRGRTLALGQP